MSLGPVRWCDSHAHLDVFDQEGLLPGVLARAAEAGVSRLVAIGGSAEANARAVRLAQAHPARIAAAVGFDRDAATGPAPDWPAARALAAEPCVRAVGEAGLDYHYEPHTAPAQRALFEANLALAAEHQLPIVVHTREADEDTAAILTAHARAWRGDPARIGVIHCFTGGLPLARRLLEEGYFISFSGIVTFKKSDALRAIAAAVPADRLLVETDAPYLAPVPHRGERNEPCRVPHIAAVLATVRGVALEEMAVQLWCNTMALFGWPEEKA